MNVAYARAEPERLGEPEEERAPNLTRPNYPDLLQSPPGRLLELVEERPLGDTLALLGAHLDVARREQEDPVGDGLDVPVHRVREPGAEVHHPPRKVAVHVLEVQDDRLLALVAVGEVLGVVEARRLHDAYPRGALVRDGAKVGRLVLAGVAFGAAARPLAAEEVAEGGSEGGGALRAAEPADRRPWLATRARAVGVVHVSAVLFLFVLVVIVLVHTEAEPGCDPVETVPNSHPASLRAPPPRLASGRS